MPVPLPPNSAAQTYRPTVPSFRPSMPLNMLSDGMRQLCIAGIIRLADEMDLCRDRNNTLGGEEQMISDSYSQLVWRTYAAVKEMELTEKECILYAEGGDRDTWEELGKWTRKLQKTMDEVEQVITCRTPFFLPKRMVRIDKITPWLEQCQDITSET